MGRRTVKAAPHTSSENNKSYLDEDKIQQDSEWDGLHGIITNDKSINAQEAIGKYARLWVIEEQFRVCRHEI